MRTIPTSNLVEGDVVVFAGGQATVVSVHGTGWWAVFGRGTEWRLALSTTNGPREISVAADHAWTRV